MPVIRLRRTPECDPFLPLPACETVVGAAADLRANLLPFIGADGRPTSVIVPARGRTIIPTGLMAELKAGWELLVRPRSSLAIEHGIVIMSAPGTIDSAHRDEIRVIMMNLSDEDFEVCHGDLIARLVVSPVARVAFVEISDQPEAPTPRHDTAPDDDDPAVPFLLLPGDRIRHRKRGSSYKVLRIISLPPGLVVEDGTIVTAAQIPSLADGLEEVVGDDCSEERVGIQVSGPVPAPTAPWMLYCAEEPAADGSPRFWLRAQQEFEGRFDIVT